MAPLLDRNQHLFGIEIINEQISHHLTVTDVFYNIFYSYNFFTLKSDKEKH